jgi:hypothetical protein
MNDGARTQVRFDRNELSKPAQWRWTKSIANPSHLKIPANREINREFQGNTPAKTVNSRKNSQCLRQRSGGDVQMA